jgi:hypothetical protein
MTRNKILRKFVSEIDSNEEKDYLDIRTIFTTRQKNVYTKLERTMDVLFSSKNIYEGLSEIIEQHDLTQNEQVFVLMILKMYEVAFSAFDESNMNEVLEQMATARPPPMGDSPEVA